MVKHTQAIRRNLPTNCFSVFDHFVILGLNRLKYCDLAKASLCHSKLHIYSGYRFGNVDNSFIKEA